MIFNELLAILCWVAVSNFICLVLFLFIAIIHCLFPLFEIYHLLFGEGISRSSGKDSLEIVEKLALDEICRAYNLKHDILRQTTTVTFGGDKKLNANIINVHFYKDLEGVNPVDPTISRAGNKDKSILLVHGAMCGPTYFRHIIKPLLDEDWSVHCICIPGFGPTDEKHLSLLSLDENDLLDFYAEFMRQHVKLVFPDVKPVIFAHSFGAFLTMNFCHKHSELVAGQVLSNAIGIFPFLGKKGAWYGWMFDLGFPNRLMRKFGYVVNSFLLMLGRNTENYNYTMLYDLLQMTCSTNIGDVLISKFLSVNIFEARWTKNLFFDLMETKVPIMMLYATDDDIMPLYQSYLVQEAGNALSLDVPVYEVSDCWHHPIRSPQFNDTLKKCLANIPNVGKFKTIDKKTKLHIESLFSDLGYASLSTSKTSDLIERAATGMLSSLGAAESYWKDKNFAL